MKEISDLSLLNKIVLGFGYLSLAFVVFVLLWTLYSSLKELGLLRVRINRYSIFFANMSIFIKPKVYHKGKKTYVSIYDHEMNKYYKIRRVWFLHIVTTKYKYR